MNAVKKNLSGEKFFHFLSDERKFVTATSRMQWKKFSALPAECGEKKISPLPVECGEKKISPLKSQTLQIFTANFNAYLNSHEIS